MSVIDFAEKRYKECCENGEDEDARYWAAYLDGVRAYAKEKTEAVEYIDRNALLKEIERRSLWGLSGTAVYEAIKKAPTVDAAKLGICEGCAYSNRRRPQKCSCCVRNADMKDCYETEE